MVDSEHPRPGVQASFWIFVGLGGFACGLTMLWLGMRAVMNIGGFCAEGGPFVIEDPCPRGTGVLTIGGVWMAILFAGFYVWQVLKHRVPSFAPLLWSALFLALGWNFLEFGVNPPWGGGPAWGWLVCAFVFGLMGGVPLVVLARPVVRGFTRGAEQPSWKAAVPTPKAVRTAAAAVRTATAKSPAGAGRRDGRSRIVKDLERLVEMHRSGGLSDEEFAAAKRKLLGSP